MQSCFYENSRDILQNRVIAQNEGIDRLSSSGMTYEYACENTRIAMVDGDTRYEYVIDKVSSSFSNLIEEKIYRRSNTEASGESSRILTRR